MAHGSPAGWGGLPAWTKKNILAALNTLEGQMILPSLVLKDKT